MNNTCPNCHAPLSSCLYAGQSIDRCRSCGGVWFDSNELGPVISALASRDQVPFQSIRGAGTFAAPKNPAAEPEKDCPRCHCPTHIFNYAYDSNIFLNRCPSCDGIWVDRGELIRLASYSKGNPMVNAMASELVKLSSHRRNRFHRILTSRPLSAEIALFYMIIALISGDGETIFRLGAWLIFPLACIWFSDSIGSYVGFLTPFRPPVTRRSPPELLAFVAWVLLLTPLVAGIIAAFQ